MKELFDAEKCTDDETVITGRGAELVAKWTTALVDAGYKLYEPSDYKIAASFLISNGHSEFGLEATMIALTFLPDWEEIENLHGS